MTQKSASAQCMSLLYTGHPILDECVFNSDAFVDRSFSQSCTLCCFHKNLFFFGMELDFLFKLKIGIFDEICFYLYYIVFTV